MPEPLTQNTDSELTVDPGTVDAPPPGWEATFDGADRTGGAVASATRPTPRRYEGVEIPDLPGFEILGELGRGAMGVVYKAKHLSLNRIVALKMILSGEAAGPKELARFQTEAEASAALAHPNVAQLYEIGSHQGLPFFALEYCDGGTLSQRLRDNLMSSPAAAELVRTLALAVQAAHDQGILHRDLKPANILLSRTIPKITDFGMAKRFDPGTGAEAAGFTLAGTIIGTPSYMAPEQTDGRASKTSDVYSLGAILYECLTGRPPFRGATALDTLISVMEDEPVPPSQFVAKLPADLEAICLKCLQKPPEDRYESAQALADDLGRFIDHRPTLVRPAGTVERFAKWAKRRPAVAALLALGCVSLLGFAGLSVGLYRSMREAAIQRDSAMISMNDAKAQRGRAMDTVAIAFAAVDDLLEQEDLPGAGDPEMQRQAMLNAVGKSLEKLGNYAGDDRDLQVRSFKSTLRRGRLLVDLAKLPEAIKAIDDAVAMARRQLAANPADVEWRRNLASALNRLAGVHDRNGQPKPAIDAFRESEELRRALVKETGAAEDEHDLAVTLSNRSGLESELPGKLAEAEGRYKEARDILVALAKKAPDESKYKNSLARNSFNWARGLVRFPMRIDESLSAGEEAKRLWSDLVAREPASSLYQANLATCLLELGKLQQVGGDPQVAFDTYTTAIASWREVVRRHPKVATFQGNMGITLKNLGLVDVPASPPENRTKLLDEAVRVLNLVQALPYFRPELAEAYYALGKSQVETDAGAARRAFDQAIVRYEEVVKQFPDVAAYAQRLALAKKERAKLSES